MKKFAIVFVSALLIVGCSKSPSETDQASRPAAVEADNSGRNVRDRDDATKTAGDQSENEQDRTITQNVRKAVSSDDTLSTDAKNVKIITSDGTVTLRGPVKNQKEKAEIEAKAKQIAGVKNVDNQLEIAN